MYYESKHRGGVCKSITLEPESVVDNNILTAFARLFDGRDATEVLRELVEAKDEATRHIELARRLEKKLMLLNGAVSEGQGPDSGSQE